MAGHKKTCFLIRGLMIAVCLQTSHLIPQFPQLYNIKYEKGKVYEIPSRVVNCSAMKGFITNA